MALQATIDEANAQFWDELCGSSLATELGIVSRDDTSIARFDAAYLEMYPYLLKRVPVDTFAGLRVLEVGLGYGTLGQQIATRCGEYVGLDIAAGPVDMMAYRLSRLPRASGHTQQGSILDCPFPDENFDAVVAIGCYHHTGNLQRAIDETYRVLKPGGTAYIMVYNALSYRNWLRWPVRTARAARGQIDTLSAGQRRAYDPNVAGEAAPETVFTSRHELRRMFERYSAYEDRLENWGLRRLEKFGLPVRKAMLGSLASVAGLDIYATARR